MKKVKYDVKKGEKGEKSEIGEKVNQKTATFSVGKCNSTLKTQTSCKKG